MHAFRLDNHVNSDIGTCRCWYCILLRLKLGAAYQIVLGHELVGAAHEPRYPQCIWIKISTCLIICIILPSLSRPQQSPLRGNVNILGEMCAAAYNPVMDKISYIIRLFHAITAAAAGAPIL